MSAYQQNATASRSDGQRIRPAIGLAAHTFVSLAAEEAALARAELTAQARQYSVGGIGLAIAAVLGIVGALALLAAAGLGLALVLPGWAAALIIGGVMTSLAAAAAGFGVHRLAGAGRPMPLTMDSIRQDVAMIRNWPAVRQGQ